MGKEADLSINWWDELGRPQYGGEISIRASRNIENFDPYFAESLTSIYGGWMERLISDDWILDPTLWDYKMAWHPSKYMKGQLAESWEFPEPGTHVVHLRKGIRWQNIPPANGREFNADDVVFHYNRLCGLGDGFTKPSPFRLEDAFQDLISVKATDRYTIVFKWKVANPEFIMETLHGVMQRQCLENPEAIKKWGDVSDWHHAIGTGPFILKDFVSGTQATLIKNADYWGYDERYPQNKLPYVNSIKYLIIPGDNTAFDAMRAGKIDIIPSLSFKQAQAMQKTNPEILQIGNPTMQAITIQSRIDKIPFNDIRVRKAMQMAIDLPAIAKDYYHGFVEPYPSSVLSSYFSKSMKGWGFPYEEWPQDLKDEYDYNPAAARKLLKDAGYPHGLKTNIVIDTSADMELFQIVKGYFTDIGIEMEERPMESTACTALMEARKHDQLVYRPYGPLGHTYAPFQAITRLHTRNASNWTMVSDPFIDALYPEAVATTSENKLKKIMRDMNERVARQHFAISLLQRMKYSLHQPWFKGYNAQTFSISGTGGVLCMGFYCSRFWIDQNLKQSMGAN